LNGKTSLIVAQTGKTALIVATQEGRTNIVRILIDHSADLDIIDIVSLIFRTLKFNFERDFVVLEQDIQPI